MTPARREPSTGRVVQLWHLLWLGPVAVFLSAAVVAIAMVVRVQPAVQEFLVAFPGTVGTPAGTPVGFPAWLSWQHALNVLFLLLLVRTGWLIRQGKRPPAFWTRHNRPPFVTRNPPRRIGIHLWFHLLLDVLFVVNGVAYIALLFVSGHWLRVVPTSWEVVPNAVSAALQYASLDWPTDNGWVAYNALQQLAYSVTVFVAAPLAVVTGIRMSPWWPRDARRLGRVVPMEWARAVHFPVMLYFVLFVIAHVTLVLATGALRNLNHMYAGRDDETWWGAAIFAGSLLVMIAVWLVARPMVVARLAALGGKVTR